MTTRHLLATRKAAVALLVAAVAIGTAGCGVPSQSQPRVIRDAALPPEQTTPRSTSPAAVDASVYFVRNDQLVAVDRRAAGPGLDDVLAALLAGLDEAEVAAGLRTALPADASVRTARLNDDVATLDIGALPEGVTGQEQILLFAQLVLTATGLSGVDGVVFERDGRRIDAPTVDGTLVSRPMQRADYASIVTPS